MTRPSPLAIVLTLALALSAIPLAARKIKVPTDTKPSAAYTAPLRTFTVDSTARTAPTLDDIAFSRFDKPVESRNETFLVSNNTDCRLLRISLKIEYFLADAGKIHMRHISIDCDIPPHQTRQLSIRSFDLQQTYRYTGSRVPPRRQAVPFDVKLTPTELTFAR